MELAKSLNRLGTESAFSVLAEAKKLEAQGNPMIHLGLGQPDFKTPKHVVEAAKKALDDGHHGYGHDGPIYGDRGDDRNHRDRGDDPRSFQFLPSFRKKIQVACMTNPYHKSH